jgi:hypothetical protein
MTNFFARLFKSKNTTTSHNSNEAPQQAAIEAITMPSIPEASFVNHEPPEAPSQTATNQQNVGTIEAFLARNFEMHGIRDGYDYHSSAAMQQGIEKIKADFDLILYKRILEHKATIKKLNGYKKDCDEISLEVSDRLDLESEYVHDLCVELAAQKNLAKENKGLVRSALTQYEKGFLRGLQEFQETDLLLTSNCNF